MKLTLPSLFSKKKKNDPAVSQAEFAARFYRFRMFLGAYLDAYGEMMAFEERVSESDPFGMPFLRACTTKLTIAAMQCMINLQSLAGDKYPSLEDSFDRLRKTISATLAQGTVEIHGPPVISYDTFTGADHTLLPHNLQNLFLLAADLPEYMPKGFIVTGAAWWQYFNNSVMHDEIDRIMVISQEDPASFSEASATIRERLRSDFPLPKELKKAVAEAIMPLREALGAPGKTLLIRCFPLRREHGAIVMPEQAYTTPCGLESVLEGLQAALTRTYQPRAMIYRLKLGIRDRAMPFCLSFTLVPGVHARGSAHGDLSVPDGPLQIHVRRGLASPGGSDAPEAGTGGMIPDALMEKIRSMCERALEKLKAASAPGSRFEVFWAAGENGECTVLGASTLAQPDYAQIAKTSPPQSGNIAYTGGIAAYPGKACGPVHLVRNLEDALNFPIGSIISVPKASPRWSFLHDFARGAIAGDGTGHGMFARTARRFGRPTILNLPAAVDSLESATPVHVAARPEDCFAAICEEDTCKRECGVMVSLPRPQDHSAYAGRLWLPSGDIAVMARQLAPLLLENTLPDPNDPGFTQENCASFRDVLLYMYNRAVRDMFRFTTTRKTSTAPAKQLVCDVPKQFWVINLDNGFTEDVKGPTVQLSQIASLPMRAFWQGFVAKPWDGPPQIDAKGFLSVLYEATVNPELDPASQSTRYTEKNIFMIAERFLSLRCRFGFHFLSLDCLLSERERERFIIFQFTGGAANLARRIRRVHFVAEILGHFDYITEVAGDTLTARFEQGDEKDFLDAVTVAGYLFMHTRQLDMIMGDEAALAAKRQQMLDDMNRLI